MKTSFCLLPVAVVCGILLSACGGGGGTALTPVASSMVSGTISGLGSVVVNGVRYETIGAEVTDLDDRSSHHGALGMGMTVSIEPSMASATRAAAIRVQRGIQGPVSAVDSAKGTLNVAGLPVTTDASTFIVTSTGAVGRLSDLGSSTSVEVYGLPQSDGTFKATRIEIEATPQSVQLVGVVSNLNTANKTFTLGGGSNTVTITYANATTVAGLGNGSVVSIHTATTASASQYAATAVFLRASDAATFAQYVNQYAGTSRIQNESNELYGMVSKLTPTATGCSLQVQEVPTTLSSSTLCASIQNGDYVEVKGVLANGALAAYRLEFKTAGGDRTLNGYHDDENDSDGDHLKYRRQWNGSTSGSDTYNSTSAYEIYGTLSNCAGSTCTLTSNGTALTADLSTAYWEHGRVTAGFVEAKGYMTSTSTFKVTKIETKY